MLFEKQSNCLHGLELTGIALNVLEVAYLNMHETLSKRNTVSALKSLPVSSSK